MTDSTRGDADGESDGTEGNAQMLQGTTTERGTAATRAAAAPTAIGSDRSTLKQDVTGDASADAVPASGSDHLLEAQTRLLLQLAGQVTGSLDLQEVLDRSLAAMRQLANFGGGAIQLIEDGFLVPAATDPPEADLSKLARIPVGAGISGTIASTGEPIYIQDIAVDERVHPEGRKKGVSAGVRSYLGFPLIQGGRPIGVLQVDAPEVDAFDAATRALALAFAPTIAAAVQNAQLYANEREVIRRMEEADALKQDFISIVSHELRTPLTTLMGFASTLAERVDDLSRDQVRMLSERALASGWQLKHIIDDLMYAARLERGMLTTELEALDVEDTVVAAATRHGSEEHPFEVVVRTDTPAVLADPQQLETILDQLIDNAAKFSGSGAAITLRADVVGDRVEIAVEDRGRGIDEDHLDSIFGLFFQTEGHMRRSAGGLGIGLAIVKRLCDSMGATVAAKHRDGGGTRMVIGLKVAG